MLRLIHLLIFVSSVSCKSLSDQRTANLQATKPGGATRLGSRVLPLALAQKAPFNGIASVESDQTCTGVLIGARTPVQSPAYMITAGHCLIDLDDIGSSNRIYRDAVPRSDRNLVHFGPADFRIGRVLYATMKGIDLAVFELTQGDTGASVYRLSERNELEAEDAAQPFPKPVTRRQLLDLGIEALPLATRIPDSDEPIRIVSSVLPDDNDTAAGLLREHLCQHEGLTSVIEGIWHWYDLARNNCDDIVPGNSGAPIMNRTMEVFALVNTSSRQAAGRDCYTGQPCELMDGRFQVAAAHNYGTLTTDLSLCFDQRGVFHVDQPECGLDRKTQFSIANQSRTPINPLRQNPTQRTWNVALNAPQAFHYKIGPLPQSDCREPDHYSSLMAEGDVKLKDIPLPQDSGLYALCLITDQQFRQRDLRHPAMVVVDIDDHPPVLKPRLVTHPQTQEPLMSVRKSCQKLPLSAKFDARMKCAVAVLSLEVQPYEIVDFVHGWIDNKDQDCSHVKAESHGPQAIVPVASLPARLCVWAVDGAGNRAAEPAIYAIRAATKREIVEATDLLTDWSSLNDGP